MSTPSVKYVDSLYTNPGGNHNDWQPTGISLSSGQQLSITATGRASNQMPNNFGPDGNGTPASGNTFLAPGIDYFALVGKIGGGAPFFVGENFNATVTDSGELLLGYNDSYSLDNRGGFFAEISVEDKKSYRWQGAELQNVQSSMNCDISEFDRESFTIEAWIKPTPGAPYFYSLMGGGGIELLMQGGNQYINFHYRYGEAYAEQFGQPVARIVPGVWCHFSLTMEKDASDNVVLRTTVNGAEETIQNVGLARGFPRPGDATLPKLGGGSQLPFCGQLAEFRVWNSARTTAQIVQYMNERVPASEYGNLHSYFPLNGTLEDVKRPGFVAASNNLTVVDSSILPL